MASVPTAIGGRDGRPDLEVEQGRAVTIDERSSWSDAFHRLEAESIDDLVALGILPAEVRPATVVEAVDADDDAVRSFVLAHPPAQRCTCQEPHAAPAATELGQHFRRTRAQYHPALARTIGEALGVRLPFDDPAVKLAHWWIDRLATERRILIPAWLFRDVVIGPKATLTLTPSARFLIGRHLKIHAGGTLRVKGSALAIRFESAACDL